MSGIPGSGKSTLARAIAPLLDLTVIDKDYFFDELLVSAQSFDATTRQRLSRDADIRMRAHAEQADGAILVSFWQRPEVSTTSGTPTDWLATLPAVVQVHCHCKPDVAFERFTRRVRHPGHGDEHRDPDELRAQLDKLAALGPLAITPVVVVDTERETDPERVAAQILTSMR